MTTRAVFFDAGHTLLYSEPPIEAVYADVAAAFGAPVPVERFKEHFKPLFNEFFRDYSRRPENARSSDLIDYRMWRTMTREMYGRIPELASVRFDDWFDALYARFGEPSCWRMYADVEPALRDLRARGLKLGVISNWDTRLRRILRELGIEAQMNAVVISAEVGWRKPNERIFREALSRLGVAAGEAMHVGDLYDEDVLGAHHAGLRAVYIDRRGASPPPDSVPFQSVSDLTALGRIIEA